MNKRHTIYYGRHTGFVFCLLFLFALLTGCVEEKPVEVSVNAKCAIIVDVWNGEVLYEKNADLKYPPASTAKVMTAIVAGERLSLDFLITPTNAALQVEPTIAGLKTEVQYKLDDLLSAILIKSANDASRVIAYEVANNEENFSKLMNGKAKSIGMENTYFTKSSGLPTGKKDSQFTTVRDLSKMMKYGLKYQVLSEKMAIKTENIYGSDNKKISLKSHNKALFRYDNAPVGKTGYTKEAKRTFVGIDRVEEPRIIIALLQSKSLWTDIMELNDKGIILHERSHRTIFSDFFDWIKRQRQIGRENTE